MTRTAFIAILLFVSSCKLTEKDILGVYKLEGFPKTTLKINADKTFEFSKNKRNPYLHPFDHPDQYYYDTKGSWQTISKKVISLTSQTDTIVYPLVQIKTSPAKDSGFSNITFYDKYGDTVRILYVQLSDSSTVGRLHGTMPCFSKDLTASDTFEFHFYGYRPYIFISGRKINQDYDITLKPEFQPGFFGGSPFAIKRKKIIDIKRKGKFLKFNGGM